MIECSEWLWFLSIFCILCVIYMLSVISSWGFNPFFSGGGRDGPPQWAVLLLFYWMKGPQCNGWWTIALSSETPSPQSFETSGAPQHRRHRAAFATLMDAHSSCFLALNTGMARRSSPPTCMLMTPLPSLRLLGTNITPQVTIKNFLKLKWWRIHCWRPVSLLCGNHKVISRC